MNDVLSVIMGSPASLFSEDDEIILKPVISEDISESAQVSTHAVEEGSAVSDHVDPANSKLTINMMIVRDMDLLGELIKGSDKSPEEKIIQLKKWKENGSLLTYSGPVFKGIGVFKQGIDIDMKNIVITNLSFKRDNTTGGGFSSAISFEQIRIAIAKTVKATLPKAAQSTNKKGQSETGKTGSSGKDKAKSIIYQWTHKE